MNKKALRLIITWISIVSLFGAAPVHAKQQRNLSIEFRTDFSGKSDETGDSGKNEEHAEFVVQRAALDYSGFVEGGIVDYRIRLALTSWLQSTDNTSFSEQIEYAYVGRQLSSDINLKIGKVFIPMGAWENDYNILDQYFYSNTNMALPLVYGLGIDLRTQFSKQHVWTIQAFNSPLNESSKNTAIGFNTAWYSFLSDGSFSTIITYGQIPSPEHTEVEDGNEYISEAYDMTQLGVGLRWSPQGFQGEIEYDQITQPVTKTTSVSQNEKTVVETPEEIYSSIIFHLRYYKVQKWDWIFKYVAEEKQENNEVTSNYWTGTTGIEIFPDKSDHYRIHIVYIHKIESTQNQNTLAQREVNVGVSAKIP